MNEQNFVCEQCGKEIKGESLGTAHRNHCPFCLWSKHLDGQTPGDRAASCGGMMKPVGLTFKQEQDKTGELMIVHRCMVCGEVKKNRIAGDDDVKAIECLYRECMNLSAEEIIELRDRGIRILDETDEMEVLSQIEVGQQLTIPKVAVKVATVSQEQTTNNTIEGDAYTVVKGDHLWNIALRAYGDGFRWTDIYQANQDLIGPNPGLIEVDMTLTIPR